MVKTAAGTAESLLEDVRGIEHISEAHIVAGDYDIIAEVDVAEVYDVLQTVSSELRNFQGIADTKTYIALE
jgi:DNA-binding Lrp family transcriptional regulator